MSTVPLNRQVEMLTHDNEREERGQSGGDRVNPPMGWLDGYWRRLGRDGRDPPREES